MTMREALERLEELEALAKSAIAACVNEGLRGWSERDFEEAKRLAADIREAL